MKKASEMCQTENSYLIEMAKLDMDAQKLRIQLKLIETEIEKILHYKQTHYVAILKLRNEK